jgi:signal peptidase I
MGNKVFIKESGSEEFIELEEEYVEYNKEGFLEKELKNDEYFVMGDNRVASLDSRSWGPLEEEFIVGKALLRLFPLNKISVLPGKD